MKITIFLLIFFAGLGSVLSPYAFSMDKRYTFKSGIIEYKFDGAQDGVEVIYFDDWGLREAAYTKARFSLFGVEHTTYRLTVLKDLWFYNVDLKTNEATKVGYETMSRLKSEDWEASDLARLDVLDLAKYQGQHQGQEEILGLMCDVFELPDISAKVWMSEGIVLKAEMETELQSIHLVATRFEKNAVIPQNKLLLPKGIEVSDAPDVNHLIDTMKALSNAQVGSSESFVEGLDGMDYAFPGYEYKTSNVHKKFEQMETATPRTANDPFDIKSLDALF